VDARGWLRLVTIEPLRALAKRTLSTALAVLGIAVGVATVIWVVAIGQATVAAAEDDLDKLGDNLVWLEAGSRTTAGARTGSKGQTTLTTRDAAAIRDQLPLIARVSEQIDGNTQIIYGGRNWSTRFRGVAPAYRTIRRWEMARGAFFDDEQLERADNVAVIGETVRRELFGDADPLDEPVRISGMWFRVIGVLVAKGQTATGQDQDDVVMMPWTTAQKRLRSHDVTWLDDIFCSAVSPEAIPAAIAQLVELMRERHRIQPGQLDDFNLRHPEELLQAKIKSSETLRRLLFAIASIALIIGGIGVMNVMLASVTQRTREIGIRAAVGATPLAIQVQFLGEAVMLTAIGGACGTALSVVAVALVESQLGWPLAISAEVSAAAVGFSMAVGVLFGVYPARRAARIDPIEALRNE
jgi:putative ABC transport system permease protein